MSRASAMLGDALERSGLLRLALATRRRGLSPGAGLTVLTYHRVVDPGDVGELDTELVDATPGEFDAQMAYLRSNFQPVSLEEVLEARHGGRKLPPDSVLVTFDDGYLDNFEHAAPILQRHRMKALFFIATGYVTDRRLFWWERVSLLVHRSTAAAMDLSYPRPERFDLSTPAAKRQAIRRLNRIIKDHYGLDLGRFLEELAAASGASLPDAEARALADRVLMTWDHVKELRRAGMGIGSHTHTHRVLLTLPAAELAADLGTSRGMLEEQLGEPVTSIAYPVGRPITSVPAVRKAVGDAGYELGFTTAPGINRLSPEDDPLDLHRLALERGLPTGLARTWMTFPFLAQ